MFTVTLLAHTRAQAAAWKQSPAGLTSTLSFQMSVCFVSATASTNLLSLCNMPLLLSRSSFLTRSFRKSFLSQGVSAHCKDQSQAFRALMSTSGNCSGGVKRDLIMVSGTRGKGEAAQMHNQHKLHNCLQPHVFKPEEAPEFTITKCHMWLIRELGLLD